jgi:uncharacterized Zn finger protein (UPF0148 family)
MSTEIKCPNCAHSFPIEEVMAEDYKKELREQMHSFTRKKEEDFAKKIEEFSQQQKLQQQNYEQEKQQQSRKFEKASHLILKINFRC